MGDFIMYYRMPDWMLKIIVVICLLILFNCSVYIMSLIWA